MLHYPQEGFQAENEQTQSLPDRSLPFLLKLKKTTQFSSFHKFLVILIPVSTHVSLFYLPSCFLDKAFHLYYLATVRGILLYFLFFSLTFSKDLFTLYGDVFQIAIPSYALMYAYSRGDKEGTVQFIESYAVSMGVTYALKYTVNERRPNGGKHSFPSGHTSSAFSGAWYLQMRYGSRQGVPALILASLVGASRVHARAHYVHDVIASAVLTLGVNYLIVKMASAEVSVSEGSARIYLSWRW